MKHPCKQPSRASRGKYKPKQSARSFNREKERERETRPRRNEFGKNSATIPPERDYGNYLPRRATVSLRIRQSACIRCVYLFPSLPSIPPRLPPPFCLSIASSSMRCNEEGTVLAATERGSRALHSRLASGEAALSCVSERNRRERAPRPIPLLEYRARSATDAAMEF